jgi:serine/threonine protein kinase
MVHRQRFRDENARAQAHRYLPRLAKAGLTPEIVELSDTEVVTKLGQPFRAWWPTADSLALAAVRSRVIELIASVHGLGVCHRDLHDGNLVLDLDGRPLVVDLEWACEVDPSGPCYDLYGPSPKVPVPAAHLQVGGPFAKGVWWGNQLGSGYTALGDIFGPIAKLPRA